MLESLKSKTNIGLYLILGVAIIMTFFGKLTPEFVDILKYVGGFFFAVRAVANVTEAKTP